MVSILKRSPQVQKLISAYDHLPRRDQRAVQVLALALALAIVFFVIWQPVRDFSDEAHARAEAAAERLAWLESNLEQARQMAGVNQAPAQKVNDARGLMSTVTGTAQENGLVLQRFEPSGEDKMRVWLDSASFDTLARWLESLKKQYGITVDQAALDRADIPGRVNARLTLSL